MVSRLPLIRIGFRRVDNGTTPEEETQKGDGALEASQGSSYKHSDSVSEFTSKLETLRCSV